LLGSLIPRSGPNPFGPGGLGSAPLPAPPLIGGLLSLSAPSNAPLASPLGVSSPQSSAGGGGWVGSAGTAVLAFFVLLAAMITTARVLERRRAGDRLLLLLRSKRPG
jgi:hypothetical protein